MLAVELHERLRKRPSQARSRDTVDALLEAADRLLRREGYAAASTNRIARVAGFSVGSLYQYFDGKEALIGALIDRDLRREADLLAASVPAAPCENVEAALRAAFDALLAARMAHKHLHRTLFTNADALCTEPPLVHAFRLQGDLLAHLPALHAAHLAPSARLDAAVFTICRLVHSLSFRFAVEEPADVARESLSGLVSTLLARAVAERSADPVARERVAAWAQQAGEDDSPDQHRAELLADAAQRLRERGYSQPEAAARAFVEAALYDVVWQAVRRPLAGLDVRLALGLIGNALALDNAPPA